MMSNQLLACSQSLLGRSEWLNTKSFSKLARKSRKSLENTTEWTTKQTTAFKNKNKTSLTSSSKEAKEKEKKKGELTIPSLQPTEARGSLTSFPTARTELAEASQEKGKGKTNPSVKRELEQRGKQGRQNEQRKGKGEAYSPQPQPHEGDWEQQLPKKQRWCDVCWKRGHATQACWWNPINQQQQQHQQPARQSLEHQDVRASVQRRQPRVFRIDQRTACTSLIPDTLPVLSLEPGTLASTQQACQSPVYMIGQQEGLCNAPSLTETWGILVDTGAATSVAPQSFAQHLELSPAPSTLKLTTATGKAVKIFGLRHVHLQCRDLSLLVSFVIADVVTPLLGMDTILQHNLSLQVHDRDTFLVNLAGSKTQLERRGRHLYMMAFPSELGLNHCVQSSLSDMIGLLTEDKELHAQSLASRSSSGTDLVEDESLDSLCVHENFSFACLMCDKKAVVSGGELSHNSFHPLQEQQPTQLSCKETQLRNKHPRSHLHRSVELQEAKGGASEKKLQHVLSSTCVYDLPDFAWTNPACVFRGHPPKSQLTGKKS